jgi:hypothetical protein
MRLGGNLIVVAAVMQVLVTVKESSRSIMLRLIGSNLKAKMKVAVQNLGLISVTAIPGETPSALSSDPSILT